MVQVQSIPFIDVQA